MSQGPTKTEIDPVKRFKEILRNKMDHRLVKEKIANSMIVEQKWLGVPYCTISNEIYKVFAKLA